MTTPTPAKPTTKAIEDGGPAFPSLSEMTAFIDREGNKGHAATGPLGMTLRDYFAAKAMQGYMANMALLDAVTRTGEAKGLSAAETVSLAAYELADKLLAARTGGVA